MKFTYHGVELDGFGHPYNTTLRNERAVELAVALHWFNRRTIIGRGLEVGNVLGHYGLHGHMVVDKYELGDDVRNVDVMDIVGRYEWIVSISTIEHVGHDELPRDPVAAQKAIAHLRSLLTADGSMLITIPGGYHAHLDDHLRACGGHATRDCTLVRDGDTWRQTDVRTFLPYGTTSGWADSVWIGEFDGHDQDRLQAQL